MLLDPLKIPLPTINPSSKVTVCKALDLAKLNSSKVKPSITGISKDCKILLTITKSDSVLAKSFKYFEDKNALSPM